MLNDLETFSGISEKEFQSICACFRARRQLFSSHACILTLADAPERVGVILSGTAQLACMDADGRSVVMEHLKKGDIFGAVFTPASIGFSYMVESGSGCEVLFFDYEQLVKRCEKACEWHSRLVSNTLLMTARKTQALSEHISLLTRRTIRERLNAYFAGRSREAGSSSFRLPVTLTALADYLGVDRSAMMREMRRMSDENLLRFKGRDITLCQGGA